MPAAWPITAARQAFLSPYQSAPMYRNLVLAFFALAVIGDLVAVTFDWRWMEIACKPLAMPLLLVWAMQHGKLDLKIALALLFSFGGDTALLFQEEVPVLFLVGLGSFLVAHLFYVFAFYGMSPSKVALWPKGGDGMRAALLIAYGVFLYAQLFPHLDAVLKIAVLVYACAITCMSVFGLRLRNSLKTRSFSPLMTGALLFVVSDSLLAINKFVSPLPYAGFLIMSTYLAAQFLIVLGVLRAKQG
jgi:uncharacterized membrane protein YhhN